VHPKKPIFLCHFNWQNRFLAKTFVGALFTKFKFYIFKSVLKEGSFDTPSAISEEKKSSSLRKGNEYFF